MDVKDIISIITALMLTTSNVAGPVEVPASGEVLKMVSADRITVAMDKLGTAADSLAAVGTAADISGAGTAAFSAVADMAASAEDAAASVGLSGQASALVIDDESLWYRPQIPMKKEHQKLLWDCCKERGLDYIDMLALISLESNFDEKCSNGKFKGYFQLSSDHGPELSKTLGTENKPLDGEINIKWGTAFYSWILLDKRVRDLDESQKRDVALSIYQRGPGGYDKNGINKKYLEKYYKKRNIIVSYFEN